MARMSFTPIGMPWSGPRSAPAASSASARAAAARASPSKRARYVPSSPSRRSAAARHCRVSSTLVVSPRRRRSAASVRVSGRSTVTAPCSYAGATMANEPDLAAGDFSTWLSGMQAALRGDEDADVPCGTCTACCTSSQFVHIEPDEADALAHIPAALLFPAPRLPKGHVLL